MNGHNDTKEPTCMACACPCDMHTEHDHDHEHNHDHGGEAARESSAQKCETCGREYKSGETCACSGA